MLRLAFASETGRKVKMRIHGGYKTLSPIQLCNGLAALRDGSITYRAFRAYLGLFEMKARREAAERTRKRDRSRRSSGTRFTLFELQRLTGGRDEASVRRDVNQLERVGLVRLTDKALTITETPLPFSRALLERSCQGSRSRTRPMPFPRPVLRFLARCRKPSLAKTLLAVALRGLSFDRETGVPKGRGTAKASWIAEFTGLSLRAAKSARTELIKLGWMSRDTGSRQWKLNRDGAYFVINLDWRLAACGTNSAPQPVKSGTESAPPIERQETPNGVKTRNGLGSNEEPSIRNVREGDLNRLSRMESLYWQAEMQGFIHHSESTVLSFIAAAVRAREVGDDPPRVFSTIIRRGLWSHISGPQEDYARRSLARYREDKPLAFRRKLAA